MKAVDFQKGQLDASSIVANSPRKNNSSGGWVVQKFGGTSVGKFALNIAEQIVR
jgi:aspartate kinase